MLCSFHNMVRENAASNTIQGKDEFSTTGQEQDHHNLQSVEQTHYHGTAGAGQSPPGVARA